MDFKISDKIEEKDSSKKQMSNTVKMVIVVAISLVAGISVFLISNHFLGDKKTEVPITSEPVSLTDSNVQEAYSYVTYGTLGQRFKKFVSEANVSQNSFTNQEKFAYAFMLSSKEDFISTGNKDENGLNIYSISNDKVSSYMQKIFGDDVIYPISEKIDLVLDYTIDDSNMVSLQYDSESASFLGIFNGVKEKEDYLIEPYIAALAKATKKTDGTLELQERVVYTDLVLNSEDNYTLNIYKDFGKTSLLESKPNMNAASLKETQINITNYYDAATVIVYQFKKGSNGYYFVSSTINS